MTDEAYAVWPTSRRFGIEGRSLPNNWIAIHSTHAGRSQNEKQPCSGISHKHRSAIAITATQSRSDPGHVSEERTSDHTTDHHRHWRESDSLDERALRDVGHRERRRDGAGNDATGDGDRSDHRPCYSLSV